MDVHGNHGYEYEMSDQDHIELAAFLRTLTGMVIISGYDCQLYADLYRGWRMETRRALADGALERREILWLSPNIVESQRRLSITNDIP
jgi:DNA adenine methylase